MLKKLFSMNSHANLYMFIRYKLFKSEMYMLLYFVFFLFLGYTDEEEMNQSLREKLSQIPDDNFNILSYLICFLSRVATHSQSNHMPVENLATIFGPCMFQ